MTAIATTTAFQVKTMSTPSGSSSAPSGPRRPNSFKRIRPVATGGTTSGSETRVSRTVRPGNSRRASSHAMATPGGSMTRVATAAISTVNPVTSTNSPVTAGSPSSQASPRRPAAG